MPRHLATVNGCRAWATLFGLSLMIACGPSARQQTLCDLQKNVGHLEQRLRHSEAHARALDEQLMVLGAPSRRPDAASPNALPSPQALPQPMPEEGISLSAGQSLAAGRSIRLVGPKSAPAGRKPPGALPKQVQQALNAYRRGATKQAFMQLQRFARVHRQHPALDTVHFWMGECKFEQGAMLESIAHFARLEREHPESPKAPEALLKMALAFEQLAEPTEASATYRRLIHIFPRSACAELATSRLAKPASPRPAS